MCGCVQRCRMLISRFTFSVMSSATILARFRIFTATYARLQPGLSIGESTHLVPRRHMLCELDLRQSLSAGAASETHLAEGANSQCFAQPVRPDLHRVVHGFRAPRARQKRTVHHARGLLPLPGPHVRGGTSRLTLRIETRLRWLKCRTPRSLLKGVGLPTLSDANLLKRH